MQTIFPKDHRRGGATAVLQDDRTVNRLPLGGHIDIQRRKP